MGTITLEKTIENGSFQQMEVAPDVLCVRTMIVNVVLVGKPEHWVLVDTGLGMSAQHILNAADERFGSGSRPQAIILTHAHFDHAGSVVQLAEHWNVDVYVHELEMPYVTGGDEYPPANPGADPGLLAQLSVFFPRNAVDVGDRAKVLPPDGSVPPLPGWTWIHTPGHTPGMISLFRESDRILIAADTFTTVRQESAYAVLTQRQEVHGPPSYFTPDYASAMESIKRVRDLQPAVAVTGHGIPMQGDELTRGLDTLVRKGPALVGLNT